MKYSLTVFTGDVSGAGTDSDVFVKLSGSKGQSSAKYLDKSGSDDFERASLVSPLIVVGFRPHCSCELRSGKYDIECQPLGELKELKVWHDGSGFGSDWFLEKVTFSASVLSFDIFVIILPSRRWWSTIRTNRQCFCATSGCLTRKTTKKLNAFSLLTVGLLFFLSSL